jgi:hypothetical protein
MRVRRDITLPIAGLCSFLFASSPAICGEFDFENNPVPRNNPINNTLNHDQEAVTRAINAWNLSAVGSLSASLPICLAYVMTDQTQLLSGSLKQAFSVIARSLRASPKLLIAMQAQRPVDADPVDPVSHLVQIKLHVKAALPPSMARVPFQYHPTTDAEFRSNAICPGKATLLITADELQFYDRQLPPATLFSGQLPLDSLLFLILTDRSDDGSTDNSTPERPNRGRPARSFGDNAVENSKPKRTQ